MSTKPQLFDWDDLRIFHALVSSGSMSSAARKLGIGQPTVSRRLEQLETRIGARLVTRGAEGVELRRKAGLYAENRKSASSIALGSMSSITTVTFAKVSTVSLPLFSKWS